MKNNLIEKENNDRINERINDDIDFNWVHP